jgi:prolyl oligopeptidase
MPRFQLPFLLALTAAPLLHCAGNDPPVNTPMAPTPQEPAPPPHAQAPTPPAPALGHPVTAKRPVVDEYHGTRVTDDYRWLEDSKAPEVQAWINDQTQRTRAKLDGLAHRAAVKARVAELIGAPSPNWGGLRRQGGQLFAMKFQPPKQQAFLVTMKSEDDPASERVLLDPSAIDPKSRTSIDFYVPSRDGKKVAVSLSQSGSENGTVHIYDVATGKETGDVIPKVNGGTAGGSVAWNRDGTGLYYTRYPREGERPAADLDFYTQVYFHKLGTPTKDDVYAIGKDFSRIAEIALLSSDDGKHVLASVANGDGGDFDHYLLGPSGKWATLATIPDKVIRASFGRDGGLYLLSRSGAPHGKILRLSPDKPALASAEVVVPESQAVIQNFEVTRKRIYVVDLVGGPSQIRVFDTKGKARENVAILPVSSVFRIMALEGDDILFNNQSYTEPSAYYRYQADSGKTTRTALFTTPAANFADAEVVRESCTSKDGTKVPINILRRKGVKLDGTNPALLNGYGGYGASQTPGFNLTARLWLDQGGVYAVANLRGGGEFGEEWHKGGNLTRKQNVFDDFIACGEHLISAGYTKQDKLAILGGSNGGLLMGAALTQRPELFKAVISFVGIYDMLRVELTPNGAFNVTEFGTVKDPEQFKAIFSYSPYHRVKEGTSYPATLLLTGQNDPRVDPYNSRKMAARLQAASASSAPILLRASGDTGHGMGTPLGARIEELADVYSFLFHELGVTFKAASK